MRPNASRKRKRKAHRKSPRRAPRRAPRKRSVKAGGAEKQYRYWAKIMKRDLDKGWLTSEQVDESLAAQFDKDEGDYQADGIRSASQFIKGVRAKMPTARASH